MLIYTEVVVSSGLTSLSTNFQSNHTVFGCNRELNAPFYSAASLKYHAPDTWHDTTPSHIILTLGWPVLALLCKSECQASLWYAAARDRTRDLPFPEADTLPTELPGPILYRSDNNNKGL